MEIGGFGGRQSTWVLHEEFDTRAPVAPHETNDQGNELVDVEPRDLEVLHLHASGTLILESQSAMNHHCCLDVTRGYQRNAVPALTADTHEAHGKEPRTSPARRSHVPQEPAAGNSISRVSPRSPS
jgi:hypothetical protein